MQGARADCAVPYEPTPQGYDFTAHVDHWAQSNTTKQEVQGSKTVGEVYLNQLPVFDTTKSNEDNKLYQWINRVHIDTHEQVLRDLLLFSTGEQINQNLVEESERILRDQSYIGEADVRIVSDCDDVVDLEVITREVWTMVPEVSFKFAAGESSSRFGLRDSNFLGTGKRISLSYASNSERNTVLMHYSDRNYRGSRIYMRAHLDSSSDGYERLLQATLPFYALNTKRSWSFVGKQREYIASQYKLGKKVSALKVHVDVLDTYLGFSRGLSGGHANRYRFGLHWEDQSFATTTDDPPPPVMTDDFTLAYPFFEYEYIQNKYAQVFNINQIQRVEDLYIGRFIRTRIGYSSPDDRRLILAGELNDTFIAANKILLQGGINWNSRWNFDNSAVEEGEIGVHLKYYRGQTENRSLVLGFSGVLLKNPASYRQLTLGAQNGLRGFKNRYLTGDTSYLFSAEERIFTKYEPFGLFNVGFAVFLDAGKAYYRDTKENNPGWLTDIGLGLRLIPSKAERGQVIHIDIGYPLNSVDGSRSVQVTAELKKIL